ncbi:hypothetical protein PABG_06493 [Paracoccidioides brasiliensis Pb03]|nr:hypothetical protein PABG_06493 [Paracoccidioides brasiliensis Pb03]
MEKLTDVDWDVLISGTGLPQSLLALALSRSGKKILHVDKHGYYGGSEAAFTLHEAEDWVKKINEAPGSIPFEAASIFSTPPAGDNGKLSPSRAYTLSLSPQLIYSRSRLIPYLVSSRIYQQLEFLAVGSVWVFRAASDPAGSVSLDRVPGSREDVFADDSMSNKSKRTLMKFLRHLAQPLQEDGTNEGDSTLDNSLDIPFSQYLASKFQVPLELHDPLISLSLSPRSSDDTSSSYALRNIKRHLGSIGVFGAGFGALLAKWGGGAEMSQVGSRACAVGGGVYVLNRGVRHVEMPATGQRDGDDPLLRVQLSDGETVSSKFVVGSPWDLPAASEAAIASCARVARAIMIVSSPLESLFPPTSEGGPIPAGAVVFVPGTAARKGQPPVYLSIHSSDTGECPTGQCVIYGSTLLTGDDDDDDGQSLIQSATTNLVTSIDANARILWSLRYTQLGTINEPSSTSSATETPSVLSSLSDRVFSFAPPSLDLAFDDGLIDQVRSVWETITDGDVERGECLQFEDREGVGEDGEGVLS